MGHGVDTSTTDARVVRLSVNLASDTMGALRELAARRGVSVSDAIRRAIAVWQFVENEKNRGSRLAVIEERDGATEIREVVLLD